MSGVLTGKRVFIARDDYLIATDLKKELSQGGAVVIEPAGNFMSSTLLIQCKQLNMTIPDVNLAGSRSCAALDEPTIRREA